MATGLSNKLTGQIGEYMVCAELGRLGLIATSFTGNVPEYDLLVCDSGLKSLPIQVKTTRSATWPSRADHCRPSTHYSRFCQLSHFQPSYLHTFTLSNLNSTS